MRFVVRQPVFNRREEVESYELKIEEPREEEADPAAIVATVRMALDRLPPASRATLPCDFALLTSPVLTELPADRVALAIDPAVGDATKLLRAGVELRQVGYSLALLDFEPGSGMEEYLAQVDSVGVRVDRNLPALRAYLQGTVRPGARLVAREVSSRSQWSSAEKAGFRFFQGEYFLQPIQELNREVPPSKVASLELLKELRRPVLNHPALESLIKAEPSFCYKLLRYLNSAAFFGLQKVTSIRHAMTLLGDEQLRRLLSLMATVASGDGPTGEIVATAMLRARFCELLAADCPDYGFMIGLFSLMPMIVNMQLGALLSVVRLPAPVDNALWGEPGSLRTLLDLSLAFERGQWPMVRDLAHALRVTDEQVLAVRGEATRWTNEIMAAQSASEGAMA